MTGATIPAGGGTGSGLTPDGELRRILGLYKVTCERALHYHSKMWEAANLFFWGFSLVLSASFAIWWLKGVFPGAGGERFRLLTEILAVVMAASSLLLAVYGKRVVAQQRTLFAYEHQVRKILETALGWEVQHPKIENIRGPWATGAQWSSSNFAYREYVGFRELKFENPDIEHVGKVGRDKRGAYGIIGTLFSLAIFVSAIAVFGYAIGTGVRERWWDLRLGSDTSVKTNKKSGTDKISPAEPEKSAPASAPSPTATAGG